MLRKILDTSRVYADSDELSESQFRLLNETLFWHNAQPSDGLEPTSITTTEFLQPINVDGFLCKNIVYTFTDEGVEGNKDFFPMYLKTIIASIM